jgi:hypothetical protein
VSLAAAEFLDETHELKDSGHKAQTIVGFFNNELAWNPAFHSARQRQYRMRGDAPQGAVAQISRALSAN